MNGYVWKRAGGMEKEGRLKRKYVTRGWEMSISSEKAYGIKGSRRWWNKCDGDKVGETEGLNIAIYKVKNGLVIL